MVLFKGVGAAMVTPFDSENKVNYDVLERYVEHLISGGVNALLPLGTTGEPATVTADEYYSIIEFVKRKAKGRVPVIAGAGSNSTALALSHVDEAKKAGADGVLCVTPYYNKCTQRGAVEHFKAIASRGLPVIVYNVPSRTGFDLKPQTVEELAHIPGIVGIKEASGKIDEYQSVAAICDGTDGFSLYCGDDGMTTAAMALGSDGVISVAANPAPKLMSELIAYCFAGDYTSARKLQFKLDEYISALFCEVNPIPVKKAMQLIGIDAGLPRLPLTELEPEHTERLKRAMSDLGLIR